MNKTKNEKKLSIRMNEEDYCFLQKAAERKYISISSLVRRIIKAFREDEKINEYDVSTPAEYPEILQSR